MPDADTPPSRLLSEPIEVESRPDEPESVESALPTEAGPASMRTLLGQFCEQFDLELRPLLTPVEHAVETLGKASEDLPVRQILPPLRDLHHQIQSLIDKVAEQQAYVLIFGPLKSGKSTFMNAMCAAYVSEVTCLPAYPCMVYVSHADEPQYIITRHDGTTDTHRDPAKLQETIQEAHRSLTQRLREIEERGQLFDPMIDMPDSIRRIDVKVPAGDLSESGAVLVDTPGLYSRMKFGYDRMTREFRNAAACAIFIVKTDNLFLEQVFEEFHELLELFSRIFLVVNLDAGKKDLKPDGTVAPSLEHEDPQRIIDAFENLVMSAPLKAAADEGRLQIYPVDLLGAASRRIRADRGATAEPEEHLRGEADFDALLTDLTDFLNSTEYLRTFMVDSLRRSTVLVREMNELTGHDSVHKLQEQALGLSRELDEARTAVDSIDRLQGVAWPEHLEGLRNALRASATTCSEEIAHHTGHGLTGAIDNWFENDRSLADLADGEIGPMIDHARRQFISVAQGELQNGTRGQGAGLALALDRLHDLQTAGVDLAAAAATAAAGLDFAARLPSSSPALTASAIPVRKRVIDWLLFRRRSSVRNRLFGTGGGDRPIPAPLKARRLGEPGRQAMLQRTTSQLQDLLGRATGTFPEEIFQDYTGSLAESLQQVLAERRVENEGRIEQLECRLADAQQVLTALSELRTARTDVAGGLDVLNTRYGDPDDRSDQTVSDT